jgi:hypothetical protein
MKDEEKSRTLEPLAEVTKAVTPVKTGVQNILK